MKGYKGFAPGMTCLGKQYEAGKTYEEDKAVICESGMHFCEEPLAVWDYYPVIDDDGNFNEYAEVEALGEVETDGMKSCTDKLKIGAKLSLADLIKAEVEFVREKVKDCGEKESSGNEAKIGSSGDWAKIGSSGNGAKIGSSGNGAQIGSSGDGAQIGSSGDWAKITSTGERSVVMSAGFDCIARAKKESWITLAEWTRDDEGKWYPKCVKTEQVDGERIKEDTFYQLVDGEFKEVER